MNVKHLPLEEAVEAAARQNYERDRRLSLVGGWLTEAQMYREEARHLLTATGENYQPEYPDHAHIVVAEEK